jgi:sigma-54 specific flagellar transcriptional regulator A
MRAEGSQSSRIDDAFMVICDSDRRRNNLKEMIEFLHADRVIATDLKAWRQHRESCRLVGIFLGDNLNSRDSDAFFADVSELDANVPIVVLSAAASADSTSARKKHPWAQIYELKTPASFDGLNNVLEEISSLRHKERRLSSGGNTANELLGKSAQFREICELVERVAPTDSTVLLTGESGTGKEVIARQIHKLSGRNGEFVPINCGAIPDQLLESELFGHERGAFTGAVSSRMGRFEMANGGTLFLDEIGDMPKALQVKLLRVLQERTIERVGGSTSTPVDIRLIAATHRDLPKSIDDGLFREDLYYRLSVFPINIPPLRERQDDIQPLLDEFIQRAWRTHGANIRFSDDAIRYLHEYAWPGNVREIANLIERLAVIGADRVLTAVDLPMPIRPALPTVPDVASAEATVLPEGGINLKEYLSDVERRAIEDALSRSNGVVQAAADLLGMGRTTLVEKIKRYGIVA